MEAPRRFCFFFLTSTQPWLSYRTYWWGLPRGFPSCLPSLRTRLKSPVLAQFSIRQCNSACYGTVHMCTHNCTQKTYWTRVQNKVISGGESGWIVRDRGHASAPCFGQSIFWKLASPISYSEKEQWLTGQTLTSWAYLSATPGQIIKDFKEACLLISRSLYQTSSILLVSGGIMKQKTATLKWCSNYSKRA